MDRSAECSGATEGGGEPEAGATKEGHVRDCELLDYVDAYHWDRQVVLRTLSDAQGIAALGLARAGEDLAHGDHDRGVGS